jgi:hypothetical protein
VDQRQAGHADVHPSTPHPSPGGATPRRAPRPTRRGHFDRHRNRATEALLIRGKAHITEVDGVDPDYAASARQYLGEDAARELLEMVDQPGTRMARITVRPDWVGLLDFAGGRLLAVMAVPEA